MADKKITDLTELTSLAGDDWFETVDVSDTTDSAQGSSRKITLVNSMKQPINAQTGTTYTLVLADALGLVTLSNASAITLTVPPNSSVAFAIGVSVDLMQLGAGQVTITAGAGVTLRTSGFTNKSRAQYSRMTVQKIATDTWSVMGDLAAS